MRRDVSAERADIDRVVAGKTLLSVFAETCERFPDAEALKWHDASGAWRSLTWSGYRDRVREVALGLRAIGFRPGEFGVLMARNRPEHVIADLGILHAGGTPISLYNTLAPEQVAYVAGHCEATVAFVEDAAFLEKFLKVREDLPNLRRVVLVEPSDAAESDWVITLDELVDAGRAEGSATFDRMWREVTPEDLVTLIYTSGTTGPPKGVMNTHRNVLWCIESYHRMIEPHPGERVMSYLPLAHAAERFASHWRGIVAAPVVHFVPDILQLLPHLLDVRPTWFVGVPRVWEKLYAGINAGLAAEPDAARKAAIEGAIEVGREVVAHEQKATPLPADLAAKHEASKPVYSAILSKVGLDQCVAPLTGAAPISTEVIEFFHALGLRVSEVWGMSELTAPATWNGTERIKIGTVGYAMPGVEAVLAGDGELLVRGGLLMSGYYKEPEKTAEAIDADGWLHTGDVATIDDEAYVTIVDRKKELIITAGGKNISPANLENALKEHPLIGQACVVGDRRAYLTALVVLDPEVAPAWAKAQGIEASSVAELSTHPGVVAEVDAAVTAVNERVSRVEQIKRHALLPAEWTAESEELTPTMKLKRRVIHTKYADAIEGLYQG